MWVLPGEMMRAFARVPPSSRRNAIRSIGGPTDTNASSELCGACTQILRDDDPSCGFDRLLSLVNLGPGSGSALESSSRERNRATRSSRASSGSLIQSLRAPFRRTRPPPPHRSVVVASKARTTTTAAVRDVSCGQNHHFMTRISTLVGTPN